MIALGKQLVAAVGVLFALTSSGPHVSTQVNTQFDPIPDMAAPDDVTGADCTMCHGDTATTFNFQHPPAFQGDCKTCHEEKGAKGGHGALVQDGRGLCLQCHKDKEQHYVALNCWTSSCHSDVHGSNVDPVLNPSRQEKYPGFAEATAGADFVGTDTCLKCHADKCQNWNQSAHSLSESRPGTKPELRGCEGCHGPGGNHWGRHAGIGDFTLASADEADNACFTCHKNDNYVPDYTSTTHFKKGVGCISCHALHDQTNKHNLKSAPDALCLSCHESKRVDFAKFSHHPLDGESLRNGLNCIDCHDPHAGSGRAMLAADKDELCFKCHADKQGPFIYAHAGYETGLGHGCSTCHEAHGSSAPNLLKMSGRGLCLQCHSDRTTHFPAQTCWTMGCHTDHHGSNTDYFFFSK